MTEAVKRIFRYVFDTFEISRIFARPFIVNIASHRVLEKAVLIYEATLRHSIIKNGEVMDEVIYSILKEDYLRNV